MSNKNTSRTKSKKTKSTLKFTKYGLIIFCIIFLAALISLPFSNKIEAWITSFSEKNSVVGSYTQVLGSDLVVHFVDVHQGDCIMIDLPDGKNIIIDGGDRNNEVRTHIVDYARQHIIDEGEKFDYMIVTHPDEDHIANLDIVLQTFEVGMIYRPAVFYNEVESPTTTEIAMNQREAQAALDFGFESTADYSTHDTGKFLDFLIAMYAEGCPVYLTEAGIKISNTQAGYSLTFYSPLSTKYSDNNSYSPMMILEYKGHSVLLEGDTPKAQENKVVENNNLPQVDAMMLGHHGSKDSSEQTLLDAVRPTYIFISVGEGNSYNHPNTETLDRLKSSGIFENNIFRTDHHGDIILGMGYSGTLGENTVSNGLAIAVSKGDIAVVEIKWIYIAGTVVILSALVIFVPSALISRKRKSSKSK